MRVLIIEDDFALAELLHTTLSRAHYDCAVAHDGITGLAVALAESFDLIALDCRLPGIDGIEVARELAQREVTAPILMISARSSVDERVNGLHAGADDYLVKPFDIEEFLARIRALERRVGWKHDPPVLTIDDLTLDLVRREARRAGRMVELTTKEFCVLEYLMRNQGQVLSVDVIRDHVWGQQASVDTSVVSLYVHYVRRKVDRGVGRPLIRTVRGVGYTIGAPRP